jgi:hypothetical protein
MFYISTYLSRLNEVVKLKEFTNQHHFDLTKFFFNEDIQGIGNFFEEVLRELLISKDIYVKLTCIEKFIIWLDLYYNCINDYISYNGVDVEVKSFISKLNSSDSIFTKKINLNNDLQINLNAPTRLYIDGVDDKIDSIIYSIESNKDIFYYNDFNLKEKEQFLSSLPSNIFNDIVNYYELISNKIINISPESKYIKINSLPISFCNNSIFEFLKSIYMSETYTHHSNALIFTRHFNGSYESYFNVTPREFISLYKVYEKSNSSAGS